MKHMVKVVAAALVALVIFTSCEPPVGPGGDSAVASLDLSASSVALSSTVSGEGSATITVTAYDAELNVVSAPELSWASADESVATVADGVITAVAVGDTSVTVTSGSVSETVSVVVREGSNPGLGVYGETVFNIGTSELLAAAANGESTIILSDAPVAEGTADGSIALSSQFAGIGAWGGFYFSFGDAGVAATEVTDGGIQFSIKSASTGALLDIQLKIEDTDDAGGAGSTVQIFNYYASETADSNGWYTVQIPYAAFSGTADLSSVNLKSVGFWNPTFADGTAAGTIYVDNIILLDTMDQTLPTAGAPDAAASDPTDDVSKTYIPVLTDFTFTNEDAQTPSLANVGWDGGDPAVDALGGNGWVFSAATFYGFDITAAVDATGFTSFVFDVWVEGPTLKIKLVDFGGDGYQGTTADTEHEVTLVFNEDFTYGAWTTVVLPLSDFTGLAGITELSQLIITTSASNTWIDNIYFMN